MNTINYHKTKQMINLFKQFSKNNFLTHEEFHSKFNSILTSEYINFICSQYSTNLIFWKEVVFEIIIHWYKISSIDDIFHDIKQIENEIEKKDKKMKMKMMIGLKEFVKKKLYFEKYDEKHGKMSNERVKESIFFLLSNDDDGGMMDYWDYIMLIISDFDVMKCIYRGFKVVSGMKNEINPIVNYEQLMKILMFKRCQDEKGKVDLPKEIFDVFEKKKVISFKDFCKIVTEEKIVKNFSYLVKKRVDDYDIEKYSFVSKNDEKRMYQLYSPTVFTGIEACGFVSVYCFSKLARVMSKNPKCSIKELQRCLTCNYIDIDGKKIENDILNAVIEIIKKDPESETCMMIVEIIKYKNITFFESLLENKDMLSQCIPRKIKKLYQELENKNLPLSESGIKKVKGFIHKFEVLQENIKSSIFEKFKLNHTMTVEIRKELIREYIMSVDERNLKNFILQDPLTEGIQLRDMLVNAKSPLKIDETALKNSIFYLTLDVTGSSILCAYDFSLNDNSPNLEVIENCSHFLSTSGEASGFENILNNAFLELLFDVRPFFMLHFLQTYPDPSILHWIGLILRKNANDEVEMITVDQLNGKKPVGNLVNLRKGGLTTTFVQNKIVSPNSDNFKKLEFYIKSNFSPDGKSLLKKEDDEEELFFNEVHQKLDQEEKELFDKQFFPLLCTYFHNPSKKILNINTKSKELHLLKRIWNYWKIFNLNGTIKNYCELLDDIKNLKKLVKSLKK